ARLAPASGRDGQLSVDAFGAAGSPAARTERLVLKRSDALLVQGWAYDPVRDTPCEAVAAVVDGRAYGAVYGVERPDVAAMFGAKHANTGYRLQVEASRFGPGRHAFELRCLQPSGRSLASPPMSFEVQP
ncbi:MAG: hypothetical protein QOJ39_730, partial [Candidatus Eremiobacteraeota bacterium]|nr:hypothetical protein [Candidatus Eremiobacteraeota bacterium]